jgi:hypothetical protein
MSKLHVNQIEGYLTAKAKSIVNMDDYAAHSDPLQIKKAFLTRALAALSVSLLAETPIDELANAITDGSKDGGIDVIYFDTKEAVLYLGQSKWHDDGHGSLELGDALKFLDGVRKVLDNDLDGFNERIKSKKSDIERAVFDANAKFVLVIAHTGQEALSDEVGSAISQYVDAQNDTSELMSLRPWPLASPVRQSRWRCKLRGGGNCESHTTEYMARSAQVTLQSGCNLMAIDYLRVIYDSFWAPAQSIKT